jgi:hypothetical protein
MKDRCGPACSREVDAGRSASGGDSLGGPAEILTVQDVRLDFESMRGTVFIQATADGDLAVGFSARPRIEIFSPQGLPLRDFDLDLPAVPVRPEHIERFRRSLFPSSGGDGRVPSMRAALSKVDLAPLFGPKLPLYRDFRMDSEGNFLFILRNEDFAPDPIRIAAFSPQGPGSGRAQPWGSGLNIQLFSDPPDRMNRMTRPSPYLPNES